MPCFNPECSVEDILNVADRIVMPLGPGLGFTPLESVAFPAFQASSLSGNKAPQLPLDQDRFPIPQHDKSSSEQYKRIVDVALSKMHSP